jgi:hypothetical protein
MDRKKQLSRIGLGGILLFAAFSVANAQDEGVIKKFHQEYNVNKDTKLEIQNKYGNIDVKNWDQDKVTIDVKITVQHPDKQKAAKLLEYINISFEQTGNDIKAITSIDEKFNHSNWFNFGGESREFSIDYTVMLPSNLDVNLNDRYGDIYIDELTGPVQVYLKYGNMKANKIVRGNSEPLNLISLAYSHAAIEESNWLKIDMKYSKLNMGNSKALVVVSRYSKLRVDDCSSIVADAKYDEYRIGKLANFVCESAYSDMEFDEITKKISLTSRYGDFKVASVPEGFEEIKVNSNYGGIRIHINSAASYNIDGSAKYAHIEVPSEGKLNRIEENTSMSISGLVGRDSNTKSKVTIETAYGSVNLTE